VSAWIFTDSMGSITKAMRIYFSQIYEVF
jgi:hypothetical protein